jgi:hypothetical protein
MVPAGFKGEEILEPRTPRFEGTLGQLNPHTFLTTFLGTLGIKNFLDQDKSSLRG